MKDYHKAFNGTNFKAWFRDQLLPNLHQPSLIMLDNAAYHRVKPDSTPIVTKMKKKALVDLLEELQLTYPQPRPGKRTVLKADIAAAVQAHIDATVRPEIEVLAEAHGHRVLWTPPHYSDLNPIELVWALVKGRVARKHTKGTTMEQVKQRLHAEFSRLSSDTGQHRVDGQTLVGAIIRSTNKRLAVQLNKIDPEDWPESEEEKQAWRGVFTSAVQQQEETAEDREVAEYEAAMPVDESQELQDEALLSRQPRLGEDDSDEDSEDEGDGEKGGQKRGEKGGEREGGGMSNEWDYDLGGECNSADDDYSEDDEDDDV